MDNKPLSKFKVIELTTYVAAPMCGRLLASWGADVTKIEVVSGDVWRVCGPSINVPYDVNENPAFDVCNSGKKSITINLKSEKGMEIFHKLLADADVFLTNNRPKALKKMGIDYDSIKDRYPSLVYGAITGFGEDGPDKDLPGFDLIAYWSRSGFLLDMSEPGGYPVKAPSGYGDTISGTTLFGGIVSALLAREQTGLGTYVGVSLYGTAIWAGSNMVICGDERYGAMYPRKRNEYNPLISSFECRDGEWVILAVIDYAKYFPVMCSLLGFPELVGDPRFENQAKMYENSEMLIAKMEAAFKQYDSKEISAKLTEAGIVNDIMHHFRDVSKDEHAFINNYVQKVQWPSGGVSTVTMPPYNSPLLGKLKFEVGPLAGQHTDEVLKGIGYSDEEIAQMHERKDV